MDLPTTLSSARVATQRSNEHNEDDQHQQEVLLCIDQQIMLATNLWIQARLVNGSIYQNMLLLILKIILGQPGIHIT